MYKSLKEIKKLCRFYRVAGCAGCPFEFRDGCYFGSWPCNWKLPKVKNRLKSEVVPHSTSPNNQGVNCHD